MADLTLAAGDLNPPLVVTLMNRNVFPPAPVDLTTATGVDIVWRAVDSPAGTQVIRAATIIAPRLDGLVSYQWAAGDTTTTGRRWVAFVVHGPGGDATYAGYDVLVLDPVPAITTPHIAAVRNLVGHATPPTDDDLARALAQTRSVNMAALTFLRPRLADMLAAPLHRTTDAGTFSYIENAKLLEAMIHRLEETEGTGGIDGGGGDGVLDDPAANRIRVHSISRADHYRDAAYPYSRGGYNPNSEYDAGGDRRYR